LLSDIRGFVFDVYGTDHDAVHRRTIPLVPRRLADVIHANFSVIEETSWEWLSDLPQKGKLGRGYEVVGYVLKSSKDDMHDDWHRSDKKEIKPMPGSS
jgi:hypothetical protein